MSREEQVKAFTALAEKLESVSGCKLWITESITDQGFDRHGTTHASFGFTLKQTSWRFSGGRLMLDGTEDELYEVSPQIVDCRIDASHIEVVEYMGSNTNGHQLQRRTKIVIK